MKTVRTIGESCSDYDHNGSHIIAIFLQKPSLQDISSIIYKKTLEKLEEEELIDVVGVFKGGGRKKCYMQYIMTESKIGVNLND